MKHKKIKKHHKTREPVYHPKKIKKSGKLWTRMSISLKHEDVMLFTKYLNVLLGSGLTIDEALDILSEQATGSLLKILETLKDGIKKGGTLADGLNNYPHIFSNVFVNLIRAGESSGTLQENLGNLTLQMEKEHELRQKIRGALIYPAVVFSAAILVTIGIIVFVMPNLVDLFVALKIEIPASTRAMIWISDLFRERLPLVIIVFLGFVLLITTFKKLKFVKPFTHWVLLKLPVVGKLSRDTNLARFTRLMGTMLKSGMTLNEVLKITKDVLQNERYRRVVARVERQVSKGSSISSVLQHKKNLFPVLAMRLIKVGEETGTLDKMLIYIAEFYEEEIDNTTKNLSTLLEPFVIILIGVVVALLASSIITPIYKVIGSVNQT
jgi:type IV pilus assembly protein PilC